MDILYFYYSADQEDVIRRNRENNIPPQRHTTCFFKGKQYSSAHRRKDHLAKFSDNIFVGLGTMADYTFKNS